MIGTFRQGGIRLISGVSSVYHPVYPDEPGTCIFVDSFFLKDSSVFEIQYIQSLQGEKLSSRLKMVSRYYIKIVYLFFYIYSAKGLFLSILKETEIEF